MGTVEIGEPAILHQSHFLLVVTDLWGKGFEGTISVDTKGTNLSGLQKNLNTSCEPNSEDLQEGRDWVPLCSCLLHCGWEEMTTSVFLWDLSKGGQAPSPSHRLRRHWTFYPFSLIFNINVVFTLMRTRVHALPSAGLFVSSCNVTSESCIQ